MNLKVSFIEFYHSREEADNFDYSWATWNAGRNFLHLMPNEIYTQFSKIYTNQPLTINDYKLIGSNGEIPFAFGYVTKNKGYYQEINFSFRISDDRDSECLRIEIDTNVGTLYSNQFICSELSREATTLVSYRHDENHYGIPYRDWESVYSQIRLPLYYHSVITEEDSEEYTIGINTPANIRQSRVERSFFDKYIVWAGSNINRKLAIVSDTDRVYFKNTRTPYLIENQENKERSVRHYPRPYVYEAIGEVEELNESEMEVQCNPLDLLVTGSFLPEYLNAELTIESGSTACDEVGNIIATYSPLPPNGIVRLRLTFSGGDCLFNSTPYSDGDVLFIEQQMGESPLSIPYTLTTTLGDSTNILVEVVNENDEPLGNSATISHSCAEPPIVNSVVSGVGCCVQNIDATILLGDCENTSTEGEQVYLTELSVGSVVYTDSALTIPFDGMGETYRFKIGTGIGLLTQSAYRVSSAGVITEEIRCVDDVEVIEENVTNTCASRCAIEINIGIGEPPKEIQITGSFSGNAFYADTSYLTGLQGQYVGSNVTETIATSKKYYFGIDAFRNATTGNDFASSISVSVDGQIKFTHSREHTNENC